MDIYINNSKLLEINDEDSIVNDYIEMNKRKNISNFKWLLNRNFSCYYDSFYSIFIFSLLKILINEYKNNIGKEIKDMYINNFKFIIEFCKTLFQKNTNDFIYFFDEYLIF